MPRQPRNQAGLSKRDGKSADRVAGQAKEIAAWAAETLAVAEHCEIKTAHVEGISLSPKSRALLRELPKLPKKLLAKLDAPDSRYTVAEWISLIKKIGAALSTLEPKRRTALLKTSRTMANGLYDYIVSLAETQTDEAPQHGGTPPPSDTAPHRASTSRRGSVAKAPEPARLYQFRITLLGAKPPIWRRIQTLDCTIRELHMLIQASMGWTNSHLYEFQINGERFGDPDVFDEDVGDPPLVDAVARRLSQVLPANGNRFEFHYLYDFGDSWEHTVLFEGWPSAEKGKKYPLCLEGERACPPEDIGGIWAYADFLEAMADSNHPRHGQYREWVGGKFDPAAFDPARANKRLRAVVQRQKKPLS